MAPESHFTNPFFNDKSLALQIVEASRFEQNHVAKPQHKSKHGKNMSDSASVRSSSSFGSSVGLLKDAFRSSSKQSASLQQKKILRNQVNFVG